MISLAILFFVLAVISGILGFGGFILGAAASIFKVLLFVFLVIAVFSIFGKKKS
ncbi:DUF1328 domain-containing protein [Brackiella oedipodis]|uniref:DUF1328 domain-containing protein n=1 Tax=Brackiella oedipodis TaxID=124225 RepID=UPI00048B4234|nr:DUF1328 domain-containing protein [Brackiella oedipodis]